jgi:hypothetical protein
MTARAASVSAAAEPGLETESALAKEPAVLDSKD